MAEGNSRKGLIGIGIFLVVGAITWSVARLAGLGPPNSNSPISQGENIGSWIGTAIGIVMGIMLIVKGLITGVDKKSNKDS